VLVQLDDAVQRADLEAGQTQAALDQQALDRAIELQKRGVGSDVTLDGARAAAETSASQVTKLQAVLDQKQLSAPFAGTIGIPRVELGQYVQPGTVVATLQDWRRCAPIFPCPNSSSAAGRSASRFVSAGR
jgi:membrane fusion protein (multidrug efflux system)